MRDVLLIFVRNPVLGKVKSRLARGVGQEEALRIYKLLLNSTREACQGLAAAKHLYYSDFVDEADEWPNALFLKKAQIDGGLGEKMEAAFREAFQQGAERVLIIGSDCPELRPDILEMAFEALYRHDFVVGPVPDGGYYALGMRTFHSEPFQGIEWSTSSVRSDTLNIIENMEKTVFLLPELMDVDTQEDWEIFLKH